MRRLSAHDLLGIWEVGEDQHPLDRALTILAAACPELTRDELAALSIGQRDARLLALRELTYGPRLEGFVECPRCAEGLEFDVSATDLKAEPATGPDAPGEALELVAGGLQVRFRLPDSRDLASVLGYRDPAAARDLLVRRCVLEASREGDRVEDGELPGEAVAEISRRMAEHDPQAEVLMDFRCPACDHRWQALFDALSFFWTELAAQARRLLREVHTLARAYGWREADILGMSTRRRRFYLEMIS
jgi:hypothetical protein